MLSYNFYLNNMYRCKNETFFTFIKFFLIFNLVTIISNFLVFDNSHYSFLFNIQKILFIFLIFL